MKPIFTRLYIYVLPFIRNLPLIILLAVMGTAGYGQQSNLASNQFTPLTNDVFTGLTVTSSTTIGSDDFSNKENVINEDLDLSTSWAPDLSLGGSAWLEVKDNNATGTQVYPAGSYAGFVVEDNGLLGIGSGLEISTYLGNDLQ